MKCSNCSKRVKPIVVSDIDGTLSMYHEAITSFSARYFGTDAPVAPYYGDEPFRDYLGLTQEQHRAMKLAYRQGGNKRFVTPWFEMVRKIILLRMTGAEIWVATTRPYQRLDNIDPDTTEWLRRNKITVDGLLYGEDKYQQLVDTVEIERIVVCYEDLYEQMDIGIQLGLPMYMIERLHNTGNGRVIGHRGTEDQAYDFGVQALLTWERKHG